MHNNYKMSLIEAVINNDIIHVHQLLIDDHDINEYEYENGPSALHKSIKLGYDDISQLILTHDLGDLNIDYKPYKSGTVLYWAICYKRLNLIPLILKHKPDASIALEGTEYDPTPLSCAVTGNHLRAIKMLLSYSNGELFHKYFPIFNQAIHFSDIEIIDYLYNYAMEHNIDLVNQIDQRSKESPILIAVRMERITIINYLLDRGADINDCRSGNTPLHIALYLGEVTVLKFLRDSGANISIVNKYGQTPYQLAMNNYNRLKQQNERSFNIEYDKKRILFYKEALSILGSGRYTKSAK